MLNSTTHRIFYHFDLLTAQWLKAERYLTATTLAQIRAKWNDCEDRPNRACQQNIACLFQSHEFKRAAANGSPRGCRSNDYARTNFARG